MKAARFLGAGVDLEIAFIPVPIPGEGESLIAVRAVGLCGSDMHITQGHTATGYTPITLGHEISGVVEKIKSPSSGICLGDRVFVNPIVGCGHCRFCTAGEVNFCPERSILGIQRDGGAGRVRGGPDCQPNRNARCGRFCGNRTDRVGRHGKPHRPGAGRLRRGHHRRYRNRRAAARGARVVAIDTDPAARARCLDSGAWQVFDPADRDLVAAVLAATCLPGGLDGVIDCVGIQPTFSAALNLLRNNGQCAVIGIGAQPLELSPPAHFLRRSLPVSGVYGYTNTDIAEVSEHLINGSLDLRASVSARLSLDEVNEGIRMFADRRRSPVRVIIEP